MLVIYQELQASIYTGFETECKASEAETYKCFNQ